MGGITYQLSVVLGTYNRFRFLQSTIESIRRELEKCSFFNEIIVIDGGSTDGTLKWLMRQKDIVTILQHNSGEWRGRAIERRSWGYFMNLGFKCAQGKYVCMLSDDCLVVPGAIRNGVDLFEKRLISGEKVGAMAFYWRNWPEEKEYRVGLTFGNRMFVNHGLYFNRALAEVGYIDETSYFFYHADGDLCLKMWEKGYVCIDAPDSYIEHYAHANLNVRSANASMQKTDWATYEKKWKPTCPEPVNDWIVKDYNDSNNTVKAFPKKWFRFNQ